MVTPPAFCRDWQTEPPVPPRSSGPPPAPPPNAVEGTLIGLLISTSVPAGQIVPVLPRGLSLPSGVAPTDEYPVSIACGFQDRVKPARFPWMPGADYIEFAVGVSDLVLVEPIDGFTGPCAILGRLDLNELLPIVLGRLMGLQKVLRLASTTERAFSLQSFWRRSPVAAGSLQLVDQPVRASDCRELAPLVRTFDQPVVSRSIFGTLAFTRFTWHWDQGCVQPVACDLTIDEGLGRGRYVHPASGADTRPCAGVWQLSVPWTMEAFQKPGGFTARASSSRPRG